ncbi:MAG: hypothetical protein KY432_11660, partial [Acidobacteria bacterium]|nr:hypothetical protein [Acidobacteriota bacterium]
EDLDAVFLLQRLNESIAVDHPAVVSIADGSPRWPMVCWPVKAAGGLGFGFQWDRDWARDSSARALCTRSVAAVSRARASRVSQRMPIQGVPVRASESVSLWPIA